MNLDAIDESLAGKVFDIESGFLQKAGLLQNICFLELALFCKVLQILESKALDLA